MNRDVMTEFQKERENQLGYRCGSIDWDIGDKNIALSRSFQINRVVTGEHYAYVAELRKLRLFSTRFSIVAEINVKLLRQGVTFLEVASYRQVGMKGSTSFSLRNLAETATVFWRLLYEVYFGNPKAYSKRPVRVTLGDQ